MSKIFTQYIPNTKKIVVISIILNYRQLTKAQHAVQLNPVTYKTIVRL